MSAIAEDWDSELRSYPAWAIMNACRWWMSRENEQHRRKPLPGDIADRAHEELQLVRVAKIALTRFSKANSTVADFKPENEPIDMAARRKAADEVLERAGYAPKKFGGAE